VWRVVVCDQETSWTGTVWPTGVSRAKKKKIMYHAVVQLVEALRYKPESCVFDSRWCNWNFSLTILPVALWAWS
jgi:hypothetical protein